MASAALLTPSSLPSDHHRRRPSSDADFEFLLVHPVAMLPADQLFSGGMLLPLPLRPPPPEPPHSPPPEPSSSSSPKAPRCSSRWKELFGLKRAAQRAATATHRSSNPNPNPNPNPRAIKHLLSRTSKSPSPDVVPLLRDHDAIDRARFSLDSAPRLRVTPEPRRAGRSTRRTDTPAARCASVDSPRMNSSGKVVFQNLGRSSSSPGSFAGGSTSTARRSYSANVSPVLNVPVWQLFSPQKREIGGGARSCKVGTAAAAAGNHR